LYILNQIFIKFELIYFYLLKSKKKFVFFFFLQFRFAHLTNYSVNKNSQNFMANEKDDCKGSKWSILSFKEFLK
jgi:hypothetical protein